MDNLVYSSVKLRNLLTESKNLGLKETIICKIGCAAMLLFLYFPSIYPVTGSVSLSNNSLRQYQVPLGYNNKCELCIYMVSYT